jgi:hypothetical protein
MDVGYVLIHIGARTRDEVNRMSFEDRRNTLIVEINKRHGTPISMLQGFHNMKLAAIACNNYMGYLCR